MKKTGILQEIRDMLRFLKNGLTAEQRRSPGILFISLDTGMVTLRIRREGSWQTRTIDPAEMDGYASETGEIVKFLKPLWGKYPGYLHVTGERYEFTSVSSEGEGFLLHGKRYVPQNASIPEEFSYEISEFRQEIGDIPGEWWRLFSWFLFR